MEAKTATGGIFLENTGNLTVGSVIGFAGGATVTGASGDISIVDHGSLTVGQSISGPGDISLYALGTTSNLTVSVNSGISSSGGGDILLSGDQTVTVFEDLTTSGSGTITLTGNSSTGAKNIVIDSGAVVIRRQRRSGD